MIYVITSKADSHRDIVQFFEQQGARHVLTESGRTKGSDIITGKKEILRSMLTARLLPLRKLIGRDDSVLVFGWHALPLMLLTKLRLIPRPRKLVVTGLFIQSDKTRRIVNRFIRLCRFDGLHFIAYSSREVDNLVAETGIDKSKIHLQLWRLDLDGRAPDAEILDGGYIFSGGYSNRDYDTLLRSVAELPEKVVVAASKRNVISVPQPKNVSIHHDIPEAEFELLLAKSRVAVIPLKDSSDACGQSVLLRVLRNGKPLIATRHSSIELYLGTSYGGFVEIGDVQGLQQMLSRAMNDAAFRAQLASRVANAQRELDSLDKPGAEIFKLVTA